MTKENTPDENLDDILASIRSIVMEEEPKKEKKSVAVSTMPSVKMLKNNTSTQHENTTDKAIESDKAIAKENKTIEKEKNLGIEKIDSALDVINSMIGKTDTNYDSQNTDSIESEVFVADAVVNTEYNEQQGGQEIKDTLLDNQQDEQAGVIDYDSNKDRTIENIVEIGQENLNTVLLTDVIEVGNKKIKPIMTQGVAAQKVEYSIHDLVDILNSHRDSLPPEFFELQEEYIKKWLNSYLPEIVEQVVREEIKRIIQYVQEV